MAPRPQHAGSTRRELLAASGALLLAAGCEPRGGGQLPGELLGPMVGHVTERSAALWAHAGFGARLTAELWRADAAGTPPRRVPFTQRPDEAGVSRALLEGLEPSTRYGYRVRWNEHTEPGWTGGFRTAPPAGAAGTLRVAVSSCMKPSFPGTGFERLLRQAPDLHLLLGDNAYADSTRPEVLWREHRAMRRVPALAAALRNVPTYAIWDDHDYGGDDVDGTLSGKHRSLTVFRQLFANPGYGLSDVPGVFSRFAWGDVDVFLLDVRFHRSPKDAPDGPDKRVLGAAQMRWLEEGLRDSRATFKLIASGSALEAPERDTWRDYPTERARLFRILAEHRVGGVVVVTGDLHRNLLQEHPPERTGTYAVPEVVSSGIANSKHLGFAVLDLDTTLPDPELTVRVIEGDGAPRLSRTFRRSQLAPPG